MFLFSAKLLKLENVLLDMPLAGRLIILSSEILSAGLLITLRKDSMS